jgi:hypothetical protein
MTKANRVSIEALKIDWQILTTTKKSNEKWNEGFNDQELTDGVEKHLDEIGQMEMEARNREEAGLDKVEEC